MNTQLPEPITLLNTIKQPSRFNPLRHGLTSDLAAIVVPCEVMQHFAGWQHERRYVAAFEAHHGASPNADSTLGQWAAALPIMDTLQVIPWLNLGGADTGEDSPINARLVGDLAARAAKGVLPQIEGQPWESEIRHCADLIGRLAQGARLTQAECRAAAIEANRAVSGDCDHGRMWTWREGVNEGEAPTVHMFHGTACQVPHEPSRDGAPPTRRQALYAAFVIVATLDATAPRSDSNVFKVCEVHHMVARHAVEAALVADSTIEDALRQHLGELLVATVPASDPVEADIGALRFESAAVAAEYQARTESLRAGYGPIHPEVVAAFRDTIAEVVLPLINTWRAAGRPGPFCRWAEEELLEYHSVGYATHKALGEAHDRLRRAMVAAFMQGNGGRAFRAAVMTAARTVDSGAPDHIADVVIESNPPLGDDLINALGWQWAGETECSRRAPRLFTEKHVRTALVCIGGASLTEDEWSMEPALD